MISHFSKQTHAVAQDIPSKPKIASKIYKLADEMTIDNTPIGEYQRAIDFYISKIVVRADFEPRPVRILPRS